MGIGSTIGTAVERGLDEHDDRRDLAVTTWRYLRMGLIALAIGLGVAVAYERMRAGCWQTSISAYYYTPAQGVLVGGLVAIGVCLICLRGASDGEDVLLNLAGIGAPFVALVPLPDEGDCAVPDLAVGDQALNVGNNITALLVVAWLSLAFVALVTVRNPQRDATTRPSAADLTGYAVAVAVLLGTTVFFVADRGLFLDVAHYLAATLMFVFVFLNVCLNAVQRYRAERKAGMPAGWDNRYARIAVVMLVDVGVHGVLLLLDWSHWILTLEASLIALFTWFWVAQTFERWADGITPTPGTGMRPDPGGVGRRSTRAR
ncbi:hypothetical protein SAMN05660748_4354 [Blastococcus aggregatus]|uniref:Frag1/DRAM/Sfk1 family protein n=1 Tax=Blastococcus aggregatus TaxID=38502 RepID=A0A285VGL3_9ACTN|nr:hypothetical protein [Blastococcus aggregatus]SOC53242.1 hypothetical protein SAMN05660748_4354 [Blastococcus aggregatus]